MTARAKCASPAQNSSGHCMRDARRGDTFCSVHAAVPTLLDVGMVALKEAKDRLDLGMDESPGAALLKAASAVEERYRGNVCRLCGGPALPCALRHAEGRSCA